MKQILCFHCGEPMRVAQGKRVVDENGKTQYINNDQSAYFHGHCRTEARRMMRKNNVTLPFVGSIRRWLKTKNKYGQVVFKPYTMPAN